MIQRVEAGRNLNQGMISDLGATISEQIGRGVTAVHMDASQVVEFDSQTLESLLEFDELARSRDLSFVISEPSELLLTALQITGLDERLEVAPLEAPEVAAS